MDDDTDLDDEDFDFDFGGDLDSLLSCSQEEFVWLEGVDGSTYVETYGGDWDGTLDELVAEAVRRYDHFCKRRGQYWNAWHNRRARQDAADQAWERAFVGPKPPTWLQRRDRVNDPRTFVGPPKPPENYQPQFKPKNRPSAKSKKKDRTKAYIYLKPEGSGKSSMVAEFALKQKVVFCSKTNDQLDEAEAGFRQRWPHLRIGKFVSRARHIQLRMREYGIDYQVANEPAMSPYAPPKLDKTASVENLQKALDAVSAPGQVIDAADVFKRFHDDYDPEKPNGAELDIIMLTIAAFQSFATTWRRTWWQILGMQDTVVVDGEVTPKTRWTSGDTSPPREVPVCIEPNPVVFIDDPDKSDFDWLRLIPNQDDGETLYWARRTLSDKRRAHAVPDSPDKEITPENERVADRWNKQEETLHHLVTFKGKHFERRHPRQQLGFGLTRGAWDVKMYVLTTELVTARYAQRTFDRLHFVQRLRKQLPDTTNCHVTTIATKLVRRHNHALLIPIVEELRCLYPNEFVTFIGDGLGSQFNLMNVRGRNDLTDHNTVIKLAIPHPDVSTTLQAHLLGTSPDWRKAAALIDQQPIIDGEGGHDFFANVYNPGASEIETGQTGIGEVAQYEPYNGGVVQPVVPTGLPVREQHAMMLADACNQALGRNQGNRHEGKAAVVLIDPIYYSRVVEKLRYRTSTQSDHASHIDAEPGSFKWTDTKPKDIVWSMRRLLQDAVKFGMSDRALQVVEDLTDKQKAPFLEWRAKRMRQSQS